MVNIMIGEVPKLMFKYSDKIRDKIFFYLYINRVVYMVEWSTIPTYLSSYN